MQIFEKQSALKLFLNNFIESQKNIGFVPTMGALHDGHLSLIQQSMKENDLTIISIFVNPTQFNNPEDLKKYPRNTQADIEKIKTISEDIIVYTPSVDDIYDGNTVSEYFDYDGLEHQMEGKHRPGHFDGVGTIIQKLFGIVNPTFAYFGEKDFQQLQIVRKLVQKLALPTKIVACPIFREPNGLAMSSRNERLTTEQRAEASFIYKTLKEAKQKFKKESASKVKIWVEKAFENNKTFRFEYFEIADEETLLPCVRKFDFKKYRGFIAVFVGEIRLIDTIGF